MKAAFFSLLVSLFFICGVGSVAAPSVLRMGNGEEPKGIDPHLIIGFTEAALVTNAFEPLANFDPKTSESIPGVAEKWSHSKDGLVWTFKLRKNAKWSNGESITAADFVYSWTRLLDPKTASEYAFFAYFIKNGEKFNKGIVKDPSQLGLKALNRSTFQLTLERPTPYLERLLWFCVLSPVHRGTIEKFGADWTRVGNFVSNGPYVLARWEINKVVALKKNPHYWDHKSVSIDQVEFYPIEDRHTEEKMFRAGQLDMTLNVPVEKVPFWSQDKSGVYRGEPFNSNVHLKLNVTKPPFNDVRIRRAVALAIDRTSIVKNVTKGEEPVALAFTPPGTGGYTPKKYLPADLSSLPEAKKLLADAGFPEGKGFPATEIIYNSSDANRVLCEAIQAMLKQNLGINVAIRNMEWKVFLDTQGKKDFQASRSRWVGDFDDPYTFLNLWTSSSGLNHPGYSNKEYDEKLEASNLILNVKKRHEALAEVESILMRDLPIIPLFIEKKNFLVSKRVKGWSANRMGIYPVKHLKLEPGSAN